MITKNHLAVYDCGHSTMASAQYLERSDWLHLPFLKLQAGHSLKVEQLNVLIYKNDSNILSESSPIGQFASYALQ